MIGVFENDGKIPAGLGGFDGHFGLVLIPVYCPFVDGFAEILGMK